jgi:hypothetical protein
MGDGIRSVVAEGLPARAAFFGRLTPLESSPLFRENAFRADVTPRELRPPGPDCSAENKIHSHQKPIHHDQKVGHYAQNT